MWFHSCGLWMTTALKWTNKQNKNKDIDTLNRSWLPVGREEWGEDKMAKGGRLLMWQVKTTLGGEYAVVYREVQL